MKRITLVFCLLLFVSGCATLIGSVPFHYVPSLNTGQQNNASLGIEKFIDSRPVEDKKATESISDIDEKVTSKFLEDFRTSRMFAVVDFPVRRDKDDFIFRGEIKRFYWKATYNPMRFIPGVNLLLLLGIPVYNIDAVAEFKIQLIDGNTGVILVEYDKIATKTETVSLYSGKSGEMGAELAEAFRDVAKQIKDGITSDIRNGKIKLP